MTYLEGYDNLTDVGKTKKQPKTDNKKKTPKYDRKDRQKTKKNLKESY